MKTYFISYESEVKKDMYTKGCKVGEFDRGTTPIEAFRIMLHEAEEVSGKKVVATQFNRVY